MVNLLSIISAVILSFNSFIPATVQHHVSKVLQKIENNTTTITFNFMGDCALATQYGEKPAYSFNARADVEETTYFFEKVMPVLEMADFNIANCEGVFTDENLERRYKGYTPAFWFKSETKNAKIFADNGIDLVSIANNHIYDFNAQGRLDTIEALEENGVMWTDDYTPAILEKDGVKIAVFGVTLWRWDINQLEEELGAAEEYSDIQIVFFHGGTEKVHTPDASTVVLAHNFVDWGADLVIGGHAHVLQPIEEYKGVTIAYSMGNFVYGGNLYPENRTMIYQHTFKVCNGHILYDNGTAFPCYIYTNGINEFQPSLMAGEDKQKTLEFLYD